MSGKKIMEKKYSSNETNIDLTELPHGIFLLTVFSEGKSFTQKIIHWRKRWKTEAKHFTLPRGRSGESGLLQIICKKKMFG